MRITILPDYAALSAVAAGIVAGMVWAEPETVLGLPTGATPKGMYRALVEMQPELSRVETFNLDEYVGIPAAHPQSYASFMHTHLFDHTNIAPHRRHILNGMASDLRSECADYEATIRRVGGIDLTILGLGPNGHIGFNEPGAPWDGRTRPVALSDITCQANARFFRTRQEIPRKALTMGICTILESRRILLLVSGAGKAAVVQRFLEGPATPDLPATALRSHPDVLVLLDEAAASRSSPPLTRRHKA